MSSSPRIFVHGIGAVTPMGWGMPSFRTALQNGHPPEKSVFERPKTSAPLVGYRVPPSPTRPAFLGHPRLRRSGAISHFVVAAALEALGCPPLQSSPPRTQVGIITCLTNGCVQYSSRLYNEVIRTPGAASPLLFPETVFNAPASHLGAYLGATTVNNSIVGSPGAYLHGLALATQWLNEFPQMDGCIVVGAEETGWVTAEAFRLFSKSICVSEGAGAVYLRREPSAIELKMITDSHSFFDRASQRRAARRMRESLGSPSEGLLCDSLTGHQLLDASERAAWMDWPGPRLSLKRQMGEAFAAAAAWQCVAAADALQCRTAPSATVSVVSGFENAIGARFTRT